MAGAKVRFRLLGDVQVLVNDEPVPIGGRTPRAVLALLLLHPNQLVLRNRMLDALRATEPPASARSMAHVSITRLRRLLAEADPTGATRIDTIPHGYRLVVDETLIDVTPIRALLAQVRRVPLYDRSAPLLAAQALFPEPAGADFAVPIIAPELTELRLAVIEARIDADLALGLHKEVLAELTRLVFEYPYRERFVEQRMLALHRSGMRASALTAYQRFVRIVGELGASPGPELRAIYHRVLAGDTASTAPVPERRGGVTTIERTTTFPVSIYLSDEPAHGAVEAAVVAVFDRAGVSVVAREDPILGSWFRRMSASAGVRELGAVAAHAADSRLVLAHDAQVTATLLQHLGPIITSLDNVKESVIRLGAVLIVKFDEQLVIHQLTAAQQLQLDHQPHLALSPRDILTALELTHGTNGTG